MNRNRIVGVPGFATRQQQAQAARVKRIFNPVVWADEFGSAIDRFKDYNLADLRGIQAIAAEHRPVFNWGVQAKAAEKINLNAANLLDEIKAAVKPVQEQHSTPLNRAAEVQAYERACKVATDYAEKLRKLPYDDPKRYHLRALWDEAVARRDTLARSLGAVLHDEVVNLTINARLGAPVRPQISNPDVYIDRFATMLRSYCDDRWECVEAVEERAQVAHAKWIAARNKRIEELGPDSRWGQVDNDTVVAELREKCLALQQEADRFRLPVLGDPGNSTNGFTSLLEGPHDDQYQWQVNRHNAADYISPFGYDLLGSGHYSSAFTIPGNDDFIIKFGVAGTDDAAYDWLRFSANHQHLHGLPTVAALKFIETPYGDYYLAVIEKAVSVNDAAGYDECKITDEASATCSLASQLSWYMDGYTVPLKDLDCLLGLGQWKPYPEASAACETLLYFLQQDDWYDVDMHRGNVMLAVFGKRPLITDPISGSSRGS